MAVNALFNLPRAMREKHYRGIDQLAVDFSDDELRQRFRFGRQSIQYLADELSGDLERYASKATALSVQQQIMIALRFYASGGQMQVVRDTMGFHKSMVSTVINDVTDALVARTDFYIYWPNDIQRRNKIKNGFYQNAGFPNVIGCVDGTHVRIQAPTDDEPSFVNRKNYHSINVQGICDDEGMFLLKMIFSLLNVLKSKHPLHPIIII